MIKNARQYRIAKREATRFEKAIDELERDPNSRKGVHPRLVKAQKEALSSQLASLRAEIDEYESLHGRKRKKLNPKDLEDLPRTLIQARIAAGLTQKELAERLGIKEQQIQRYETTDYASASLARMIEIARALSAEQ
jgi:ribosome-binding protein aMBF1 (putative translation factor)